MYKLILIVTFILCLSVATASSEIENLQVQPTEDKDSYSKWGLYLGFYIHYGRAKNERIEKRIRDFDSSADTHPGNVLSFNAGARYHKNYLQLEAIMNLLGSDIYFMDEEHFFETNFYQLLIWYRRLIPIPVGKSNLNIYPGAGFGFIWAEADIGKYDYDYTGQQSTAIGPRTDILSGSGSMFLLGLRIEYKAYSFKEEDSLAGVYIGFSYHYSSKSLIMADVHNDGDIFFPDGSEFELSKNYFGIGITVQN